MKSLPIGLLLTTSLALGCGSSANEVNGTGDFDATPPGAGDATVLTDDAPGVFPKGAPDGASPDLARTDIAHVEPVLTVRLSDMTDRSYARGTRGATFLALTLIAHRDVELYRLPLSFDQVRESACAIGNEGAPNYRAVALRNGMDGETALAVAGELLGSPGSPRATGELGGALPIRLAAGSETAIAVTADVRLTDPRCPFLNQGVRVTVGDQGTGRLFPAGAVGLTGERRLARPEEIVGDRVYTGMTITVMGPDYGQPLVTDPDGRRGEFWFCDDPLSGLPGGDANGYRGCCTNGRWRSLEPGTHPQSGMLVRSLDRSNIYYLFSRRDGTLARAFFPSSGELNSWRHPSGTGHVGIDAADPSACLDVIGLSDADVIAIQPGGNVTYRPGSTYVRIAANPTVWAVGANRVASPIALSDGMGLEGWMRPGLVRTVPEAFFVDYRLGMPSVFDRGTAVDRALATFAAPTEQIETSLR